MTTEAKTIGGHFHPSLRVYDHVLADISRERPLTGEGYRILLCLLGNVGRRNLVPGPSSIAKELKLDKSNTWRQYQQMVTDGYMVKDENGYRIHPFICWRGSDGSRDDAIRKVLMPNDFLKQAGTKRIVWYRINLNGHADIAGKGSSS